MNIPRQVSREGIENGEAVQAYNRISRWPQFGLLRRMILSEIRACEPEGTIVDVGCGPGYLVAAVAKSFPRLHIIGVDISEEMIQQAARNVSSLGLGERVEFRQRDVKQMPFEDNSVDFVVSTLSLHHWSESKESLEEIHRVLKPEGQFLIFDLRRDARQLFYWLLHFAQRFVVPAELRSVNEPTGSARSSYTPAEVEAIILETPFQQYKIKPGFGWMFIWGRKSRW
ncbi:MAG: class I SAM-dependent methyltransferase [Chloroflexi bacterium]|nr:class I SAM-dependent methyltransferase [Chloroflexota bacterium]